MSNFLRALWKQKPPIRGPVEAVQRDIRLNAERVGIDPASISLYLPMWGPGDQQDYGIYASTATNYGTTFEKNKLSFNDDYLSLPIAPMAANDYTIIININIHNTADNDGIISGQLGGNPKDGVLGVLIGGASLFYQTIGSSSPYLDAPITKDKDVQVCIAVNDTAYGYMLIDNEMKDQGQLVNTSLAATDTYVGRYSVSGTLCRMIMSQCLIINSFLNATHRSLFSDHPYLLLQRNPQRTWFIPSGAGLPTPVNLAGSPGLNSITWTWQAGA